MITTFGKKRLARAWAILAALTILSVGTALTAGTAEGGSLMTVSVALTASYLKARQVLDHFLDLQRAGSGWRSLFSAILLLILGGTLACHAVQHLR